jgi:L-malate glycosyltransferase
MNCSLLFIGPLLGRNLNWVTTQGEILSDQFIKYGYIVSSASSCTNRYIRLLDIIRTILAKRNNTDLLMLQVYAGRSFIVEDISSLLAKFFNVPTIMTLRGGNFPEFMSKYPAWTRRVLKRAEVIVTPSEYLARAVRAEGFEARVISNVIDLDLYPYKHRKRVEPKLLWMRKFHKYWNPEMAIRVLYELRKSMPEATLVMAGQDEGLEKSTRELARSLGLEEAVRFPGFLNTEGKIREAAAADIFINTNLIDNMPVSVLEACSMGLPVVSTDVGGMPDLLTEGETGLLVPVDDVERMVEAIKRLVETPELASRLSENGRRLAMRSSWTTVRCEWESLFREILKNR